MYLLVQLNLKLTVSDYAHSSIRLESIRQSMMGCDVAATQRRGRMSITMLSCSRGPQEGVALWHSWRAPRDVIVYANKLII